MEPTEVASVMEWLMQFGVAGLMGVLWVWERGHSRKREAELSDAHRMLIECDLQHESLMQLVHGNTKAMTEFEQTLRRLGDVLEVLRMEIQAKS